MGAPGREASPEKRETTPAQRGAAQDESLLGASGDLLDHADPHLAAEASAVENLLRCWVREAGLPAPDDGVLRIPLPSSGTALLAPVHYWSPTGWHRFGLPHLADAPPQSPPADAVTVAALLTREGFGEIYTTCGQDPASQGQGPAVREQAPGSAPAPSATSPADLVVRVADSVRRTATFISERRKHPADVPDLFLAAEQALVLGHPLHPTPKSREGLSEAEAPRYSPELRGSFPLHWLAVAPSVLATDSAWTERGRSVPAAQLTARLAGAGLSLPDGHAALPLHPWQLREVRHRPETAALFDVGLLRDLGAHGSPWHPTSSVRTVHASDAPAMLKLSLGLRVTNSRRENLRKELHRGVEVHRLLRSGLFNQWQATHPGFDIVRDPAWLAVDGPDGNPVPGLDVMIRHNPFRPADDVTCIAGLVSPRPHVPSGSAAGGRDADRPVMCSRLAVIVSRLAARTDRPRGAVAVEWFLRYLEQVVRPVLWLDAEAGIALEAHQQNTLLLLDDQGWPVGGRYRDNQGYYFRESRREELDARLPGVGRRSDTFVSDEVTDERFTYYLAINNVLGLIGAFGSQRLADERLLLAAFRRFLGDVAAGPDRLRSTLPTRLLDSPVLRCKANLLTRLHGLDELVGPVDTQSVYVTIANPLHT
ncbi:iron transport protein [Streptomyces lincolnensis]|uniref:Iron transport protein n=1 Tax=Streptomyces lincolnensis TaxID=1915 RepID=A0A1B1MIJ2_STRLN|nr:IucA/IucC family protein [Streptomyces lincolnensis]ANS68435.1 iron transport protein [Streptomyces lincolnensis]AXG53360.1 iron transport protein [Streptomyces lincolnensis]QMV10068.1 iron transporter [Streptomyces lincolnensis]